MRCTICRSELADEAIYRGVNLAPKYPGIRYLCGRCGAERDAFRKWGRSTICVNCGRPVISSTRPGRPPKLITCSEECTVAALNAADRHERKEQREPVKCEACGKAFLPKRTDASYCSVACKQRAYRQRVRGSRSR